MLGGKKIKKIVLFMPSPFPYSRPWRGVPLSLLAISRILAKEGYRIKIVSRFLSDNPEKEILEETKDALCFGVSAMVGFQIFDGLKIARLVKEKYPKLPIVWGGWHPSILPEQTVKNKFVDIVVKGQGDRTFPELVHALNEGKSFKNISGLVFKEKSKIMVNRDRLLEDINGLPPMPYHLVDMEKCITGTEPGERSILYLSSYGCTYQCGFCVEPAVYRKRWFGLKAEKVVEEWEYLSKKYDINTFVITDSNFFVDKQRIYDICKGVLKKGLKIKWKHANGRIAQLVKFEPEIWEAMKKSGCTLINTGAESGLQEALDLINKEMKVQQTIKFTELCQKYRIKIQFSFLAGLPWSKDQKKNQGLVNKEFSATFDLINKLMKISNRNRFTYYVYLPYPGAPLFNRAVDLGLEIPKSLEEWSCYLLSPDDAFSTAVRQKWISKKQAKQVNMLSQYIFAVVDKDNLNLIEKIADKPKRIILKKLYRLAQLMVKLRWRFKFFALPLDYRIFSLIRQYGKLE